MQSIFSFCNGVDEQSSDRNSTNLQYREDFKVAVVMLFDYKPSKVVDLFMFYIFLGVLFEKVFYLTSAKKAAQLYSNETNIYNRGFLTFEDFKRAFNSVSPKLSEKIRVKVFGQVDQDSDGCISFKEFESAMKYGQDEVSPVYFA
uniref:EF-hand calcium binding domain 11 n=1 Tax=Athene cunicularia TaxID=194338 RepID=A0A663M6T5_ATHCN